MKTVTSREFNQDVSKAKRFAAQEPVFVTDRGKPTHVLIGIDAYRQLVGKPDTLPDLLAASAPLWDPLESTCRHASLSIL